MSNEELVQEYQNGNHQALEVLMEQNIGLVKYFADKYFQFGKNALLDFDDLMQDGWIGFMNAAKKYNFNRAMNEKDEETTMFSSYAGRAIQNNILRSINKNIPREKKSDTYSEPIRINSIDKLLPDSDVTTLEALLPDEKSMESFNHIDEIIDNEILRKDIFKLLDIIFGEEFTFNNQNLNGVKNIESLFDKLINGINTKEVLFLHYGLFEKPMSFEEIGKKVGLSSSRIEQIEKKGIYAIRMHSKTKEFMEKYEIKYIDYLETKGNSINMLISPDRVLSEMEYVDDLLNNFI